jgi:hypothetical protein
VGEPSRRRQLVLILVEAACTYLTMRYLTAGASDPPPAARAWLETSRAARWGAGRLARLARTAEVRYLEAVRRW